ncbi:hypothetical protein GCM10010937_00600 [Gluconobacter japonicus]|uniref:Uncharacterized protein n=1 Tax=Gluconobacter japonicus TaxID=376620 RepID=A0ABQ5WE96_GLUJA|nr:hypothetical protein GCM10010937_00600 [Gluconobacter japonicus]
MGTDYGTVDHMLPVIGQAEVYQGLQQSIPHPLLSPTPESDIDRVPFAVALMHVPPRTACAQNMQHTIEKQAIVSSWSSPTSALRRQKRTNHRPFLIRQIASCHARSTVPSALKQPVNQISG